MKDLIVIIRAKDLTKGVFKVGSEVTIDTEDMVIYHGGLEWKVKELEDGNFALLDGGTVFAAE